MSYSSQISNDLEGIKHISRYNIRIIYSPNNEYQSINNVESIADQNLFSAQNPQKLRNPPTSFTTTLVQLF